MKKIYALTPYNLITHQFHLVKTPHPSLTKKILLALFFSLITCIPSMASSVQDWFAIASPTPVLSGGVNSNSVVKTDQFGNSYVGTTLSKNSGSFDTDMLIIKYDCHGQVVPGWPVQYDYNTASGLAGFSNDQLTSIDVDKAGNVYVVGTSQGSPRLTRVIKYGPSGGLAWHAPVPATFQTSTTAGISVNTFIAVDIAADSQGNMAVAGNLQPTTSSLGNRIAAVKFRSYNGTAMGTAAASWLSSPSGLTWGDQPQAMTLKLDPMNGGRLFVTGGYYPNTTYRGCVTTSFDVSTLTGGPGTFLPILVRTFGINGSGVSVAYDPAYNRVYTLASLQYGNGSSLSLAWLILSYDANTLGNSSSFGMSGLLAYNYQPGNNYNYPVAIRIGSGGRVVALGRTYNLSSGDTDYLLAEWNYNAVGLFAAPLAGFPALSGYSGGAPYDSVHPKALQVDSGNNAYITGYGEYFGGADYLTMRIGAGGNQDWSDSFSPGPGSYHYPSSLALNVSGDVFVTGIEYGAANALLATVNYDQGPPANDTCATAKVLPNCNPGTVAFNTTFANSTAGGPNLCGANNKDVWFRWVAPCNGQVDLDTFGSCYDTVLAVYRGSCGSLLTVPGAVPVTSCNDDANAGRPNGSFQSYVTFPAIAGTTYFFQVGGKISSLQDKGEGRLTIFGPTLAVGTLATGPFGPWHVYRLNGTGTGLSWPWSVTIPCGMNVQGLAAGSSGTALNLAQNFATSLNSPSIAAIAMPYTGNPPTTALLWVRAKTGGCGGDYTLRVGPNGTPYDQLCQVPNVLWGGSLSTLASVGQCQFNPIMEEESVSMHDANRNGIPDALDIAQGTSFDVNTNGMPDEIETGCTNGSVYSMSLPAGLSYLANQLDNAGGNTVSNLLSGVPLGSTVYSWNGSGFDLNISDEFGGGWVFPTMPLNPGQPFLLNLPQATTLTFAGCPHAQEFHVAVTNGCQYVASTQNAPATYEDIFGQSPTNCLTMQLFEGTNVVTYTYANGGWSPNAPVVGIGQCALVCSITCPPAPKLHSTVEGKNMILSWNAPAFHVQASPTLGSAATWTNLPYPSPMIAPTTGASGFFRLANP